MVKQAAGEKVHNAMFTFLLHFNLMHIRLRPREKQQLLGAFQAEGRDAKNLVHALIEAT